jgi:hypothetical protein
VLCASPVAETSASPIKTVEAAEPAASPGGFGAGAEVGLFPCATPQASGTPSS